jgi:hypothetical protein
MTWQIEDKESTLNFSWKECNGPPGAAAPGHRGFGHLVLTRVVPISLDGRASLEFQAEGVTWVLIAPLDRKFWAESSRAAR